ncbi:MAG TPA: M48 family metalloprotease [Burkholderiales bacterium]|nr:M48 family metalloprotease [Burkholderiales bacterium]
MRNAGSCRLALAVLALLLSDCAVNPVTGRQDLVTMSEEQEIATGRSEDANVRKEYGVYAAPELQKYVDEIGQKLARASHRPNLQYHFTVVDSPEINAFALPGGYVYVTRGILAYMNSEAELAGVIGHEIGHVTARHSVQQMSAATAAGLGARLLQIFVPATRNQIGDNAVNVLGNALLSGYGREHELEADRLGAEYLARTGYEPQAMIKVIGVLKNQELFDAEIAKQEGREPQSYHGLSALFASHPEADARLKQVIGEAAKYQQAGHAENQEAFLRRLDRTVYGDSAEQGFARQGTFYHPGLGLVLSFPPKWKIGNQPDKVAALAPDKEAIIDLRAAGPAKGSPEDVLRKALRLSGDSAVQATQINGLQAASASTSMQGRPTRATAVFLGDKAYLIGAQAKSTAAMNDYSGAIDATTASFRAMSESERVQVQPLTLRVITVAPGLTYAELARRSPLGRNAEGYLRVINGQYPTGEPSPGQPLKVVE